MSSMVTLTLLLVATLGVLALAFNHALARLAFVELALTNGHRKTSTVVTDAGNGIVRLEFSAVEAAQKLPANGIALFASNTCATCLTLIDDLGAPDVALDAELHIYFTSAKPKIPVPGVWTDLQQELFNELGIPATPYLVAMRNGEVASHGPVPNLIRMQHMLQTAGLSDRLPTRLLTDRHSGEAGAA